MYKHLVQTFVVVGIVTFGLRGFLFDLGLPGWASMVALVLGAVVVAYGINGLGGVQYYLKRLGGMLHRRFTDPITRMRAGEGRGGALST